MDESNPIVLKALSKVYKKLTAVNDVNLTVKPGEHIALLGPNGAGKTTLLEMIEGIQPPSKGTIRLFGHPWRTHAKKIKPLLGIALQETRFRELLKVREIMRLFASFYGVNEQRINHVIDLIGLQSKTKTYYKKLSGGQKQRLALGVAIMHQPKLLLLDEPTTGLDPRARQDIWGIIRKLKSQGTTMILTTHYMEEAEELCDRIIMMHKGTFLAEGKLIDMLQKYGKGTKINVQVDKALGLQPILDTFRSNKTLVNDTTSCTLWSHTPAKTVEKIITLLNQTGGSIQQLTCQPPNLNDVFLSLSGEHLDD